MMRRAWLIGVFGVAAWTGVTAPAAAAIKYDVTNVAGDSWRYDYTILNDSLAADVEEFTIYFALGLFENLSVAASPPDWDSIVAQPDAALPADGLFDSLALAGGIATGISLGGFSVNFDWLGHGTPGAQAFDIFDPDTFELLESGRSQPANGVPVGEPGTAVLLGIGLLALAGFRRRGVTTSH